MRREAAPVSTIRLESSMLGNRVGTTVWYQRMRPWEAKPMLDCGRNRIKKNRDNKNNESRNFFMADATIPSRSLSDLPSVVILYSPGDGIMIEKIVCGCCQAEIPLVCHGKMSP